MPHLWCRACGASAPYSADGTEANTSASSLCVHPSCLLQGHAWSQKCIGVLFDMCACVDMHCQPDVIHATTAGPQDLAAISKGREAGIGAEGKHRTALGLYQEGGLTLQGRATGLHPACTMLLKTCFRQKVCPTAPTPSNSPIPSHNHQLVGITITLQL